MCDSEGTGEEGHLVKRCPLYRCVCVCVAGGVGGGAGGGRGGCVTVCNCLMSRSLSVNLSPINFLGGSEDGVCDSTGVGRLGSLLGAWSLTDGLSQETCHFLYSVGKKEAVAGAHGLISQ